MPRLTEYSVHWVSTTSDIDLLVRAFVTYIWPVVEYNTVIGIWSPFNNCNIERVEKVQRRFTKWLSGLKDLTYSQRLEVIDLESLELRRLFITPYYVLQNSINTCQFDFF